jgi:hypothetical protein
VEPDEEAGVYESPVLTPSPLCWTLIRGGFIEAVGTTIALWGGYIASIGSAHVQHWQCQEERRAFSAAVVTEIESLTGELEA